MSSCGCKSPSRLSPRSRISPRLSPRREVVAPSRKVLTIEELRKKYPRAAEVQREVKRLSPVAQHKVMTSPPKKVRSPTAHSPRPSPRSMPRHSPRAASVSSREESPTPLRGRSGRDELAARLARSRSPVHRRVSPRASPRVAPTTIRARRIPPPNF